jgi:hypothetical protein
VKPRGAETAQNVRAGPRGEGGGERQPVHHRSRSRQLFHVLLEGTRLVNSGLARALENGLLGLSITHM